jgi:hypothetical protein
MDRIAQAEEVMDALGPFVRCEFVGTGSFIDWQASLCDGLTNEVLEGAVGQGKAGALTCLAKKIHARRPDKPKWQELALKCCK